MCRRPIIASFVAALISAPAALAVAAPVARIPSVTVDGYKVNGLEVVAANTTRKVNVYAGIRYAEPPIGSLRFLPPVPHKLTGDINATTSPAACIQPPGPETPNGISEDCLFLNVYTPRRVNPRRRLPVIVFIHGGSFKTGSLSRWPGESLVAESEVQGTPVIVVTLQYRLNLFGFLSSSYLQQLNATNVGLLDQRVAMEWVRTHIGAFGGDPTRITAAGQSAGAISISLHQIHSAAFNVSLPFHRAILMSGSPTSGPHPPADNPIDETLFTQLVLFTGCFKPGDLLATALCVQNYEHYTDLYLNGPFSATLQQLIWGPVVDNIFLRRAPEQSLHEGEINHVPIILGTTLDEGTIDVTSVTTEPAFNAFVNASLEAFGLGTVANDQTILADYPLSDYSSPYYQAAAIYGDFEAECPARLLSDTYSAIEDATVYKYHWRHTPLLSIWQGIFPNDPATQDVSYLGAAHATDLPFFFNYRPYLRSDDELDLSCRMVAYFTRFATHGNPNGGWGRPRWPVYRACGGEDQEALRLNFGSGGNCTINVSRETDHIKQCIDLQAIQNQGSF